MSVSLKPELGSGVRPWGDQGDLGDVLHHSGHLHQCDLYDRHNRVVAHSAKV